MERQTDTNVYLSSEMKVRHIRMSDRVYENLKQQKGKGKTWDRFLNELSTKSKSKV